jgi:transposase
MSQVTYVGLDVHLNFTVAVWKVAGGQERHLAVDSSIQGFEELAAAVGSLNVWASYEASGAGWEVYDLLTARGWKVSVLAPTRLPHTTRTRKTKTDLRDARKLQEVLMAHGELSAELPAVWIPPKRIREDRELIRRRIKLGEKLSSAKAEILSLLRIQQIKKPESIKTLWSQKHVAWIRGLCQEGYGLARSVRSALESQVRELEFLTGEMKSLEEDIEALSVAPNYSGAVQRMRERRGVGILTAMGFLVEVGDVGRFANRRKLASYLGLVPTSYDSGEVQRRGHITRMGPARVRKLLNQAAWIALKFDPEWKRWYQQLAERRGPKRAIVAVMRKLSIELWHQAGAA